MSDTASSTQPYRPFIDPLPVSDVPPLAWYAAFIPLALAVAVCYKAVRAWNMKTYWRQVALLALAIVLGMGLLAGLLSLGLFVAVG